MVEEALFEQVVSASGAEEKQRLTMQLSSLLAKGKVRSGLGTSQKQRPRRQKWMSQDQSGGR